MRSHLGASWGEGAWHSEENSFLPLEQLVHRHLVSRFPLLNLDCWEGFSNLRVWGDECQTGIEYFRYRQIYIRLTDEAQAYGGKFSAELIAV